MHACEKFTYGVEEEFFIVNLDSYSLEAEINDDFFHECVEKMQGHATSELLQSQIEINSSVCLTAADLRRDVYSRRRALAQIARQYGLGIMSAGVHPSAKWLDQNLTSKPRYAAMKGHLRMLALRNMFCGLHVHVGVPNPDMRVELMQRLMRFVPIFIALSTSSPFWQGMQTGMKAYRLVGYSQIPRTGLPPAFASSDAYETYVRTLIAAEAIPDATYLWWMLRPSAKYPTIELRAPDACTDPEDSLAIAALFRCLVHRLCSNQNYRDPVDPLLRALIAENCWRAQVHGMDAEFISLDGKEQATARHRLDVILEELEPDAMLLGHTEDFQRLRHMSVRGSSADHQLKTYNEAVQCGKSHSEALQSVARDLVDRTCSAEDQISAIPSL